MAAVTNKQGALTVTAYPGDAKTLLAFNLTKTAAKRLAGFTIHCTPSGQAGYYLYNTLQFEKPEDHAQVAQEPPYSSVNAPFHKFRWVHVPGSAHQGLQPFRGEYTYAVTPRYFNANASMQALDPNLTVSVDIDVVPFTKATLEVAFTRGFMQSQAFDRHFGEKAPLRPKGKALLFDTAQNAGTNDAGVKFSYADEYQWMGFTAREKVFALLNEVVNTPALRLDMFAYDLNEPDIVSLILKLAAEGRVRLILDNAGLHHNTKTPKPEDEVEKLFLQKKKGNADIIRGHYNVYAHDKVIIVSNAQGPVKVLTGSTNFSVTGMYVNSNHVLVFNDANVAQTYADVFAAVWAAKAKAGEFQKLPLAAKRFPFSSNGTPATEISFAPHPKAFAATILGDLTKRVQKEGKSGATTGSVLFAIMDLGSGGGPVRPALIKIHTNKTIFSFGISDSKVGVRLYAPKYKIGVLVTGKPTNTILPPPFDQVPAVGGHQIHHKFVVCGFNTPNAVVYCGSSNLASGGEESNGDNLLAIRDTDVATAFAIEALLLVDHFNFLDRYQNAPKGKKKPPASKQKAAAAAKWYLGTTDAWTIPYFDSNDLRSVDRQLFG